MLRLSPLKYRVYSSQVMGYVTNKSRSFVDKQAKPMTATTMVTGAVFSLHLLIVETCLVDFLLDIFGINPSLEIVTVFNCVLSCYPLIGIVPNMKVICYPLICMNLPSSHHHVPKITTTGMTSAKQFHQIGLEGLNSNCKPTTCRWNP